MSVAFRDSFLAFSGVSHASTDHHQPRCAPPAALSACLARAAARCPVTTQLTAAALAAVLKLATRNFFSVHLLFFVTLSLAGAGVVGRDAGVSYLDAWFLCSGAVTGASLLPFPVDRLRPATQGVVFTLMLLGGVTVTALGPLSYRLFTFRRRLMPALRRARRAGRELRRIARPPLAARLLPETVEEEEAVSDDARRPGLSVVEEMGAAGQRAGLLRELDDLDADEAISALAAQDEGLVTVAGCALLYIAFWLALTGGVLWARAAAAPPASPLGAALAVAAVRPRWYAAFFAVSAFNNVGFSLFPTSATPLDAPSLLALACATIAGNTGWPIALRALLHATAVAGDAWARTVARAAAARPLLAKRAGRVFLGERAAAAARGARYALLHPQQCYHLLFPGPETVALLASALVVNAVLIAALGHGTVVGTPGQTRRVVVFFTAVNTRSTGMQATEDLNVLRPVALVLSVFAMWFSPYPLVALWAQEEEGPTLHSALSSLSTLPRASQPASPRRLAVLRAFSERYLRRHLAWLTAAMVLLAASEQRLLTTGLPLPDGTPRPPASLFAVLYELMSAYGTNGESLGYPGVAYGLCGFFSPLGRLILIGMMFLGRHRSMPRRIDPALQRRVHAAEALALQLTAELAAWRAHQAAVLGDSKGPRPLSLAARVGSFTAESVAAALAMVRALSQSDLAAVAAAESGAAQAAAVAHALERGRGGGAL